MLQSSASLDVTVQFDEIDSFQIAHHTKLIGYLERARIQLFLNWGFSVAKPEYAVVIYAMDLDFKKPAQMLESLNVQSTLSRIEGFKLVLAERIVRGTSLIMKAKTEIVFLEFGNSIPLPVESVFPELMGGVFSK